MPKNIVDYSNTIIYKIYCKDDTIKDLYVGHTTNFIQRRYAHKIACNNFNNNLKIYNTIRCNGGWENWDMVEIAKYNCKDATEARIKEQQHYTELNTSLNSCPPYVDKKKYFCDTCQLQCATPGVYEKHITRESHIKKLSKPNDVVLTESCPEVANRFRCENCHYYTNKKSSFEKHITTSKHLELTEVNQFSNKSCSKVANENNEFTCKTCNKLFKSRVGRWKHKKKCNKMDDEMLYEITNKKDEPSDKQLIMMLIKENSELRKEQSDIKELIFKEQADIKELILEIVKNGTHNTTNTTTHTNSHNKAFNLQFFLNETCKNAMNITDFVESIKLQLTDFMSMGDVGFVEGISNIIVKNLNSLDETIRPIHCTDQKRETFYVKDENKWQKEEDDRKKLKKMIRSIAYKNEKLMKVYKDTYPDYNNPESRRSDQYSKIMIEAMDCKEESREKIIKNISKAATISTK